MKSGIRKLWTVFRNVVNSQLSGESGKNCKSDEEIAGVTLENNITLGTMLTAIVKNKNTKPEDYICNQSYVPRPSHADYTYISKYIIRHLYMTNNAQCRLLSIISLTLFIYKVFNMLTSPR